MKSISFVRRGMALLTAAAVVAGAAACTGGAPATPTAGPTAVPAPPGGKVVFAGTYSGNVQPIFDQKCVGCHGPSRAENGLRLDSYEAVMRGTQFGAIVVPSQPNQSALVSVIRGTADPRIRMPHEGARLADQETQNIVLWIEAGAPKN